MTSIRWFKLVALVEAVSYLVLLAAAFAKRALDMPMWVPIVGPVHGIVFLVYLGLVMVVRDDLGWGFLKTLGVIVAAVIPFGGLYVERTMVDEPAPAPSTSGR